MPQINPRTVAFASACALLCSSITPIQAQVPPVVEKFIFDLTVGLAVQALSSIQGSISIATPQQSARVYDCQLVLEYFRHDTTGTYPRYNCTYESYSQYLLTPGGAESYSRNEKTCGGTWGTTQTTPFALTPGDYDRRCTTAVDDFHYVGTSRFRYTQTLKQAGAASPTSTTVALGIMFSPLSANCPPESPATGSTWKDLGPITTSAFSSSISSITTGLSSAAYYGTQIKSLTANAPWSEK